MLLICCVWKVTFNVFSYLRDDLSQELFFRTFYSCNLIFVLSTNGLTLSTQDLLSDVGNVGLISLELLILNATNSWHLATLLQEFFVPFNVFLNGWNFNALLLYSILGTKWYCILWRSVQQYSNNYWNIFIHYSYKN